jgi:hypothetical protein
MIEICKSKRYRCILQLCYMINDKITACSLQRLYVCIILLTQHAYLTQVHVCAYRTSIKKRIQCNIVICNYYIHYIVFI